MKGKVLKPHPNRSCDLMQLPCQNLSSGKPVGCLGGQAGVRSAASSAGAGGTATTRADFSWEEASENRARTLGSRGWGRFAWRICLCGEKAVAER